MVLKSHFLLGSFLLFQICSATLAKAEPVLLTSPFILVSTGGISTVEFAGSDAMFDSVLYLSSPGEQGPFFPNHSTPVGSSTNLGTFASGTELVFQLHVLNSGYDFFSGAANQNPDGLAHVRATEWLGSSTLPNPGVRLGFEDLFGGGDMDFNDFQFVVTNARIVDASAAPEPASLLLFGSGIAGLVARLRRRRAA